MAFDEHREYGEPLEHEEEFQAVKMVAIGVIFVVAAVTIFYGGWFLFSAV